jgi:hypothetical protein
VPGNVRYAKWRWVPTLQAPEKSGCENAALAFLPVQPAIRAGNGTSPSKLTQRYGGVGAVQEDLLPDDNAGREFSGPPSQRHRANSPNAPPQRKHGSCSH